MKTKAVNMALLIILISVFASVACAQEEQSLFYYYERALPDDSIPADSYKDALDQQWDMRQNLGYGIAPQTAVWTSIGPSNDNYTGRVVRVKYDPTDGDIVYVCGNNGGVWKSTNGGTNFYPMCDDENIKTQCSGDVAIDPQHHNTIYWGTGGSVACWPWFNYYGIGVYKSTDGGENWTGPYTNGLPSLIFTSTIVVNPSNGHVYLANCLGTGPFGQGSGAGLYKSTDGGESWARVTLPYQSANQGVWDVAVSNTGQYVHTVSNTGYWRSTNYGASFELMNGIEDGIYLNGRTQIAVNFNYVYIVTDIVDNTNIAYVSTDGGLTFPLEKNFGDAYGCMSLDFMYVQVSPNDPEVAFTGSGGNGAYLWRTMDGGQNWDHVYSRTDQNNFAFNPDDDNEALLCTDQGLYKSTNILNSGSVNFNNISYTLSLRQNYRVASNRYNVQNVVMAAQDAGLFTTTNNGLSWDENSTGGDGTNMVRSEGSTNSFMGNKGLDNHIFYSRNSGIDWDYSNLLGIWDKNEDWIAPITEKPHAYGTFYVPRRNSDHPENIDINVTYDYGEHWTVNPSPITHIPSGNGVYSPRNVSFSGANTNIIYVSTLKFLDLDPPLSQLWRTIDGGANWTNLDITHNGIPNRLVTSVVADPNHYNTVYLTLSGFGSGHVFKSTNGGTNWRDLTNPPNPGQGSFPPDLPVNYLIVMPITNTQNRLVIATDAGVYSTLDPDIYHVFGVYWGEVAEGLPNSPCLGLDYNLWGNKLRAALFGRGIWEIQYPGPVNVVGNEVLASVGTGLDVADDIVIDSGSTLSIPNDCTIKIPAGKKIIVKEYANIDASFGNQITLTSQSGTWGGIEFEGNTCTATLKNITFSNTNTPVVISGSQSLQYGSIKIQNCVFNDGPVSIDTRGNVDIENCTFNYSGSYDPLVQGISSVGSNDITIDGDTIYSNTSLTGTAISVVYGSSVYIVGNVIHDAYNGISISNSDPYVSGNLITHSSPSYSNDGLGLDNCNSPTFSENTVTGYTTGYKFGNSSPVMLSNYTENSGADYGMIAESESSPRMAPLQGDGELVYDAGYNTIITDNNDLHINNYSIPVLDIGCNNFEVGRNHYYIDGSIESGETEYYVTYNNWNNTPSSQYYNINDGNVTVYFDPSGCGDKPGGGSELVPIAEKAIESSTSDVEPPQPLIIDRGNGFYDTIQVVSRNVTASQDKVLFAQGTKEELLGHYGNAVTIFRQLIQSYPHTRSSIKALGSILRCFDKSHADSSNYLVLRNHCLNLVQTYNTDTALFRAARNLATKTLVRLKAYPTAISEYENIISNSHDSLETLFAELNIIETYMLIQQGGDAPSFTGRLAFLKPNNIKDGLRMIKEKYHSANKKIKAKLIPKEFKLAQNYPNPFNPITTIEYSLPQNAKVVIKVYDILGRLVKELVNEYKEAGFYKVKFDGTNLASGVYLYRIEAGNFVATKKMILVK